MKRENNWWDLKEKELYESFNNPEMPNILSVLWKECRQQHEKEMKGLVFKGMDIGYGISRRCYCKKT